MSQPMWRSMIARIVIGLYFGALGGSSWSFAETRIFLVRHAEKQTVPESSDPELTSAGKERAVDLHRTLRSQSIDALFATEFKRTRQTLEPLSAAMELPIKTRSAGKEAELVEEIRHQYADQSVVVAAHSNTIPTILRELGLVVELTIGESDYDHLFMIEIDRQGKSSLLHLHYGRP